MFYVLAPELSRASDADAFLTLAFQRLQLTGAVWTSESNAATVAGLLTPNDALIFCNPQAGTRVAQGMTRVLRAARRAEASILPVATRIDARIPPPPVSMIQSWDLAEFASLRHHMDNFTEPAVDEFLRVALAQVEPTCFTRRPSFFIAHRRADGETLVRRLDGELRRRGHCVFRDLGDVPVGEHAQSEIDRRLNESDGLLFVDSPAIGESAAATHELRVAIENRIPVVWVRTDANNDERADLPVMPGGEPDIVVHEPPDAIDVAVLADDVVSSYHTLAGGMVTEASELLDDLHGLSDRAGIRVERLDRIPSAFRVEVQRNTIGLPERPLVHLCQFFGRRVRPFDVENLLAQLRAVGMVTDDAERDSWDALLLLDPRPRPTAIDGNTVIIAGREYLSRVCGSSELPDPPPRLLISGSWTDASATDSEVLRAVSDVADEWLRLGGGVVFGGHPTFTPAVIGAARRVHPIAPEAWVTMFQSDELVRRGDVDAHALHAKVIVTRAEGNRNRSLRLMRERMIQHPGIVAMVAVGGRIDSDGVDEEIALAHQNAVPVVLLAAPGGQAATIAARLDARPLGWSAFTQPPIDGAALRAFSRRTDYRGVARDLFATLT